MGNTESQSASPSQLDCGLLSSQQNTSKQPFAPWTARSRFLATSSEHLLQKATTRGSSSPLHQLILLKDWQRVLCRISLFPNEIHQFSTLRIDENHGVQVLPLHLACSLDPPPAVVQLMLQVYGDAAAIPIRPRRKRLRRKSGLLKKKVVKRLLSRRKNRICESEANKTNDLQVRQITFSNSEDGASREEVEQSLLKTPPAVVTPCSSSTKQQSAKESHDSDQSSMSSTASLSHDNIILQLSPTGSKNPMPLDEVESQNTLGESVFRVQWDLSTLFRHILENGTLLPLHVACFYSASSEVLQILLDAHPAAALCDVVGMLPIHWVAAGWSLPPILKPFSRSPDQMLRVLQQTVPDSVRIRSGSHSMTPEDYIKECMDDGPIKTACLNLVLPDNDDFSTSDDSIIFGGSDTSDDESPIAREDSTACISSFIASHDWEAMLVAVENDPSIASQWMYGLDDQGPSVWKRLPIHLACAYGAPIGLISILLRHFPEGALLSDPRDGSTPLHIACQSGAAVETIQLLVTTRPDALRVFTTNHLLPLHIALQASASLEIIETLVTGDPVTTLMAGEGGRFASNFACEIYGANHPVNKILGNVASPGQREDAISDTPCAA